MIINDSLEMIQTYWLEVHNVYKGVPIINLAMIVENDNGIQNMNCLIQEGLIDLSAIKNLDVASKNDFYSFVFNYGSFKSIAMVCTQEHISEEFLLMSVEEQGKPVIYELLQKYPTIIIAIML